MARLGLAYSGLAWLGFWPEAGPCTSLNVASALQTILPPQGPLQAPEELVVAGHATNLLTPKVIALLPQTEEDIQRRRVAYDDELDNARRLGLRN